MSMRTMTLDPNLHYMKGYAYGLKNAAFGMGTNPVLNGELACNGTEMALLQCYRNVERISCRHAEDIGVLCPRMSS